MRSTLSFALCALVLVACGAPNDVAADGGGPADDGSAADAALSEAGPSDDATGSTGGGDSAITMDATPPLPPGTPIDAGPTIPGTITVDPSTQVGTIPPAFLGLSYEKSE